MFEIALILYLIYMFNFFKTSYSISHPLEFYLISNLNDYFKHPIYSGEYESKICPFGHNIIWILVIYLVIKIYYKIPNKINNLSIIITFILSLMNFNALLYLIPYFIYEFICIQK